MKILKTVIIALASLIAGCEATMAQSTLQPIAQDTTLPSGTTAVTNGFTYRTKRIDGMRAYYGYDALNNFTGIFYTGKQVNTYFLSRYDAIQNYQPKGNYLITETDPTVSSYIKGLHSFNDIKASTDPLYFPATPLDATPTHGSNNLVRSGGIADAIAAGTLYTFTIPIRISPSKYIGKYGNGDTLKYVNQSFPQILTDIVTEVVHPTYTQPTTTISGSPGTSTIEYGSSFTETLNSTFTQNDAGSLISTTYYKGASALGGNTDVITSLTTAVTYTVKKTYNAGACKVNNLGATDCTGGPVAAGTITSSNSIIQTPGYRRYQGFISDTTGIASGSKNSVILALVNSGTFSTSQSFASFSTGTPTGTQFYMVAYVATSPDIISITQNGFPALAAFSHTTVSSFTNTPGATLPIKVYWSKNGQTSPSTISTN
jgi:hypothetical protein